MFFLLSCHFFVTISHRPPIQPSWQPR